MLGLSIRATVEVRSSASAGHRDPAPRSSSPQGRRGARGTKRRRSGHSRVGLSIRGVRRMAPAGAMSAAGTIGYVSNHSATYVRIILHSRLVPLCRWGTVPLPPPWGFSLSCLSLAFRGPCSPARFAFVCDVFVGSSWGAGEVGLGPP